MSNAERQVAITGVGVMTAIGHNVSAFWENLLNGKSAGQKVTHCNTEGLSSQIAAPIYDYDVTEYFDRKEAKRTERFMQFAMIAAREAMKDSGLEISDDKAPRAGVIIGCGIGALSWMETQHKRLLDKGPKRVSPFLIPYMIPNMASGMVSIDHNLKGPNCCTVTACASGTHAIGDAGNVIRRGEAEIMVCGGTEAAITSLGLSGFSNMQALTCRNDDPEKASRPFDKERDGFLMGEGAGIMVLEELEHAKARGANIYGLLSGYGMSGDAYHITAPAPDGDGGARAMAAALKSAQLNPEDVDCINAHGTSTPLNDKLETMAIKTVLGDHAYNTTVTSNKSMIGHLLGAAGGVEGVASVLSIKNSVIPPTINYENPDPECDLDYVPNEARETGVRVVASNSLGFGGHNTTIVMTKYDG